MIHAIGATDILATAGFVAALAAGVLFLLYARRGRDLRSRVDQAQAEQDKRFYETKGKVRRPPVGPLVP